MNKPIVLRTADIYLKFPEIMEEECDDLAEFLEDEHIVYEGATDVFIEKDKEIERLNNIIESIKEEIEIYINVTIDHLETFNEENNFELRNKCRAMREIKDELLKIIDKELKEGR